jgi:hypothetical protein
LPDWIDWLALFDSLQKQMFALEKSLKAHWDPNTDWTYLDVLHVTAQIHRYTRKNSIHLRPSSYPEKNRDIIIDEIARMYTMITVRSTSRGVSGDDSVPWEEDISLQECLLDHFSTRQTQEPYRYLVNLKRGFTAKDLERLAEVKVIWTDNLEDHLKLIHNINALSVFKFPSFLRLKLLQRRALRSPEECFDCPCFDYELALQEALWTLAVLFPSDDDPDDGGGFIERTHRQGFLFLDHRVMFDHGLLRQPLLTRKQSLKEFRVWGDRLKELKELYDDHQPASKKFWSFLMDRRKFDQWFHSWVAVVVIGLTLFFGLIQSIEGAIQVYKAYHPDPR